MSGGVEKVFGMSNGPVSFLVLVETNISGLMLRDSLRNLGYDAEKVREEMKKEKQKRETEN